MPKRPLGIDVLTAARQRVAWTFDTFEKIYISFSAGKDSTVMLHLVMEEAKRRERKVGMLLIDLEAQYQLTMAHAEHCFTLYRRWVDPYWIALPINLRNAVSMTEPRWQCWDPSRKADWVREPHEMAITDESTFPFFRCGMEFEEFVDDFGHWYGGEALTACLVGIRADESLNRFRTLIAKKTRFDGRSWTTWKGRALYNIYPIYDWRTEDLWTYTAREGHSYNALYDRMHLAGLTIHQMRICQPYGDDQRKGLWLYHVIEPETWGKVVARVAGANSGALYASERGNILGRLKIDKPAGHTWESFGKLLLGTMPPASKSHYEDKIAVFLHWYQQRGYPHGIPDEAELELEARKKVPSWRRICKALLRNDYWMKGLSFTQTESEAYARYKKIMKKRRARWGMMSLS